MVRFLSHYNAEYRIFVLSKCKETTDLLLSENLTVGELSDNTLIILPDNIVTPISDSEKARFEVFTEGDVLDVYIKDINAETKKISLGFKKAEDNPWVIAQAKYNVGDVISCKIGYC